jgi:hypothetical protein
MVTPNLVRNFTKALNILSDKNHKIPYNTKIAISRMVLPYSKGCTEFYQRLLFSKEVDIRVPRCFFPD